VVQKAGRLSLAARPSVNVDANHSRPTSRALQGGPAEEFDPTPPGLSAGDPPPEFVSLLKEMFAATEANRETFRLQQVTHDKLDALSERLDALEQRLREREP
jgi:hypothetical protein